jgi:hypothetical protein
MLIMSLRQGKIFDYSCKKYKARPGGDAAEQSTNIVIELKLARFCSN